MAVVCVCVCACVWCHGQYAANTYTCCGVSNHTGPGTHWENKNKCDELMTFRAGRQAGSRRKTWNKKCKGEAQRRSLKCCCLLPFGQQVHKRQHTPIQRNQDRQTDTLPWSGANMHSRKRIHCSRGIPSLSSTPSVSLSVCQSAMHA